MSDARAQPKKIRVLIVDDSAVARELLTYVLGTDPRMQVIGAVGSGDEALVAVAQKKPDVVTMDYHMPAMNGLDATRRIMQVNPVPIVIVSATSAPAEVASAHALLDAGALAVLEKPAGPGHPRYEATKKELLETVKWVSEVKVVKRWAKRTSSAAPAASASTAPTFAATRGEVELIAIGASTGGPLVLRTILSGLSKDFPVPLMIVQHIAPGFTEGLVEWLASSSRFPVQIARAGAPLVAGHAYVAPDGVHMLLAPNQKVGLSSAPPENGHRPSVSHLFRSVVASLGPNAAGVLLTGMGNDGAAELKLMKDCGAVTIAQDRASSVVHGMPGEAIALDAATHVLPANAIAQALEAAVDKANAKERLQ